MSESSDQAESRVTTCPVELDQDLVVVKKESTDTSGAVCDLTQSSGGSDGDAVTPSKRNKRKMTEPKRRTTDFSIRSICSNSDNEELKVDRDEDEEEEDEAGAAETAQLGAFVAMFQQQQQGFSGDNPTTTGYRTPIATTIASLLLQVDPFPVPTGSYKDNDNRPSNFINRRLTGSTIPQSSGLGSPPSPTTSAYGRESPDQTEYGSESVISGGGGRRPRKNYKNMTKQRRIEANARERTRVHTISAAFESLRRAVPSYSYNQRLSKLAILRIACSYILALARLADLDYSHDQDSLTFGDCVDLCTQTIQAEGKAKRRH